MTADNDSYTHSYRDVPTMAYGLVLTVEWWLTALHRLYTMAYGPEVKLPLAYGLTNTESAVKAVA